MFISFLNVIDLLNINIKKYQINIIFSFRIRFDWFSHNFIWWRFLTINICSRENSSSFFALVFTNYLARIWSTKKIDVSYLSMLFFKLSYYSFHFNLYQWITKQVGICFVVFLGEVANINRTWYLSIKWNERNRTKKCKGWKRSMDEEILLDFKILNHFINDLKELSRHFLYTCI